MVPRFVELNRVVVLKAICEVPRDSTLNVKVARTPLPVSVVNSSSVSDMSGMSPLLNARVESEVHMNKVCPAFCRNEPSVTPVRLKMAGLNVKLGMSHAQRPCTLL